MARPGVTIIQSELPPPRSAPTETGVWFVSGKPQKGPPDPALVRSLAEYEATFGDRTGAATGLYDAVDAYFREGGVKLWVVNAAASAPEDSLDQFTKQLGPGQVSCPGVFDAAAQSKILQHCADHNRVALLEADPASDTASELEAEAAALASDPNAWCGSLWAPHAVIPGVAAGTTRDVPFTAIEAGLIARLDRAGNPNRAAAGKNGQSVYATDLVGTFTDDEYEAMNEAGVDLARLVYGGVRAYGYRSLSTNPNWTSFGWARTNMAIRAQAEVIGERFVFEQLDGRGRTIAQFGSELRAMLVPFYEIDALYGETADDAFQVDVGNQVNTPETIANGELHAVIKVRMSPFSEWVVIEIVKVTAPEAIAA